MAEFQVRPEDGDMNFQQGLPRRVASSVREYFCYKAYLACIIFKIAFIGKFFLNYVYLYIQYFFKNNRMRRKGSRTGINTSIMLNQANLQTLEKVHPSRTEWHMITV